MDKKKIVIVTGTGGILGTGHIQRMLNLAVHLNLRINFTALIYLKQNEYPLPVELNYLFIDSIPSDAALIIQDMRDSTIEDIHVLEKIAPVITIDDSGAGRSTADYAVTLLPVPSENSNHTKPDTSLFIYGYNFTEGIKLLGQKKSYSRDIDIAVYAGYDPSPELISSIIKSIPESAVSVLLYGGRSILLTGDSFPSEIPYAEIISRTKIVITHFGLTMFEADACGCSIAALNPSGYHNKLTEMVSTDFKIIYSSEYESFSPDELKKIIIKELNIFNNKDISVSEILEKINRGTENFVKYIERIVSNSYKPHNPPEAGST